MFMRILLPLALLVAGMVPAFAACSVHDHTCQFHGMGRAVNPNIDYNSDTAVYIISEGSNSLDFDNHVLLPDNHGPYSESETPTDPHAMGRVNEPYTHGAQEPRHVSPRRYQVDFQFNTVQAYHSGDDNGGEEFSFPPDIPSGCQISQAEHCEEIRILGNIPDTYLTDNVNITFNQTNHLFNYYNVPDPEIEVTSYAVATGTAYIRNFGHMTLNDTGSGLLSFTTPTTETLRGTDDVGEENIYYIGNYAFDPHAVGAPIWYNEAWTTYGSAFEVQAQHKIYTYQHVTSHSHRKMVSGLGDTWSEGYSSSTSVRRISVRDIPRPSASTGCGFTMSCEGCGATMSCMAGPQTAMPQPPGAVAANNSSETIGSRIRDTVNNILEGMRSEDYDPTPPKFDPKVEALKLLNIPGPHGY